MSFSFLVTGGGKTADDDDDEAPAVSEALEGRRWFDEEDDVDPLRALAAAPDVAVVGVGGAEESSAWTDPLGAFFLFLGAADPEAAVDAGAAGAAAEAAAAPPLPTEGDRGPFAPAPPTPPAPPGAAGLDEGMVIELLGIIIPVPGPPPPATPTCPASPADVGPPGP